MLAFNCSEVLIVVPIPISAAKAGCEIGGKGGVSLVLLGVLYLTRAVSLSLTQTHMLVIGSPILAQFHSISFS